MPGLSTFGDFLNSTRDSSLTDPKYLINEAQKNSYALSYFLNKKSPFRNIRGGTRITETVKIGDIGNFRTHSPGDQRTINRRATKRKLNFEWAFCESDYSYTEQEVMLNDTGTVLEQYKALRESFDQDGTSDHVNGLESQMFAYPDFSLMESPAATSDRSPYSIPCFITENGLAPVAISTATAWATLAGQDPSLAANLWWRNQVSAYDNTSSATMLDALTGIIAAMDDMDVKTEYVMVPSQAGNTFQTDKGDQMVIFTSRVGKNRMIQLMRQKQDIFRLGEGGPGRGTNDAGGGEITFNGKPIIYIAGLDTENLGGTCTNGTDFGGVGGGTFTSTGVPYVNPRYFWVNTKYMFPVFNKQRFMYRRDVMSAGVSAPDTEIIFYNTWWNFVCNSRRRCGIVRPGLVSAAN